MAGCNVLITSAGRRVGLAKIAQRAASRYGGDVLAADLRPEFSAACQASDRAFAVPRIDSDEYLTAIHDLAVENDVALIIPTLDTELLALSAVREEWLSEGIFVSVPDKRLVAQCRDKRLTVELFASLDVPTPQLIHDEETFPRFVKPVGGSLSQDIHIIDNADAYPARLADRSLFVHQEVVNTSAYQEFTVDVYFDNHGALKCLVPRRRLEVRGGEISKGRTEKGPFMDFLVDRLAVLTGARGCMTAQFFVPRHWENPLTPVLGVEVNPRFGGGYPLTDHVGGRYVEWLMDEVLFGTVPAYTDAWRDGVTMLRYDAEIFLP